VPRASEWQTICGRHSPVIRERSAPNTEVQNLHHHQTHSYIRSHDFHDSFVWFYSFATSSSASTHGWKGASETYVNFIYMHSKQALHPQIVMIMDCSTTRTSLLPTTRVSIDSGVSYYWRTLVRDVNTVVDG
jgi:hypothetical protein